MTYGNDRRIPTEFAEGRIVKSIVWDETGFSGLLIVFTDGTFVNVRLRDDYDSMELVESELNVNDYDSNKLIEIGIISQEEYERIGLEDQRIKRERQERWDYDEYLRLKERFEPESNSRNE